MAKFYVSFQTKYAHADEQHSVLPGVHPDGVLLIEADDESRARDEAFAALGSDWAFLYTEEEMTVQPDGTFKFFPRGVIGQLHDDGAITGPINDLGESSDA